MDQEPQIDFADFRHALSEALDGLGLALDPSTAERMERFAGVFLRASERMNLTSVTDPREAAIKHFSDALSLLLIPVPNHEKVIDVGSGGGFPGVPLAIARPDLHVTLLDATRKKTAFMESAIRELRLDNCTAATGRAEALGQAPEYREKFGLAVWRGLGDLKTSSELCLPLVKVGGVGIAMKGPKLDEELPSARARIGELGGKVEQILDVSLPENIRHRLLVLRKVRATPERFPRPWGRIKSSG